MAEPSKKEQAKISHLNQSTVDAGNLDLSGLRIGKQRLVAKKKKPTALKKTILEEREYNRQQNDSIQPGRLESPLAPESLDCKPSCLLPCPVTADLSEPMASFVPEWCFPVGMSAADEVQQGPEPSVAHAGELGGTPGANDDCDEDLPVTAAIERLKLLQTKEKKKPDQKKKESVRPGATLEVRHYVHQVITDELDEKVKSMIGELARFQERAKERDPLKYQKLKRFCVGIREARRYVTRGRAKAIICAPNLEECSVDGGLDDWVEDLIEECREHEVPIIFALSRNRMGKALGRNIRLSLVCILSAEGVHQEFRQVVKMVEDLRQKWVLQQMANFSPEDAEAARIRAEARDARNAERKAESERLEAERREANEKRQQEARAAKAEEKARKAAAHEAEMERRKAVKAAKVLAAEKLDAVKAEEARKEAETRASEEATRAVAERAARLKREAQERADRALAAAKAKAQAQAQPKTQPKAAPAKAAVAAAAAEDSDSDSSSGSSVPLGFSAALF